MAVKMKSLEEVSKVESPVVSDEIRFSVTLPSKGKLGYPEIIECRPLKVRDFRILSGKGGTDIQYMKRLCDVVQGTILTPGVVVKKLAFSDFIKIIIALKINSTGAEYELSLLCNNCASEKRFIKKFDLLSLDETAIDDAYEEPVVIDNIKVVLPRMSVYYNADSSLNKLSDYDFVTDAVKVEGQAGINVDGLSLNTYKKIIEFITKNDNFGVDTKAQATCPECGGTVIFTVPFREEFFIS